MNRYIIMSQQTHQQAVIARKIQSVYRWLNEHLNMAECRGVPLDDNERELSIGVNSPNATDPIGC